MSIKQNICNIKKELLSDVTLVAISKRQPCSAILEAYEAGQRIFGENRHKELIEKCDMLPSDIIWHFIGSLQRSNVKYVVPRVEMIHSVDSEKLLIEIDKEAKKCGKIIDVLFEIHLAQEQSKSGWDSSELTTYIGSKEWKKLKNTRIKGVMCMASYTDDQNQVRKEFKELISLYREIKNSYFSDYNEFNTVSAGMSGDYKIAIEEGSTMVRVGSKIF